jgi:hypothetical protein
VVSEKNQAVPGNEQANPEKARQGKKYGIIFPNHEQAPL